MTRVLSFLLLFNAILAAQCKSVPAAKSDLASAPQAIQDLSSEIVRPGVALVQLITKRFGPPTPHRDYLDWRAPSGTITYKAGTVKYQPQTGGEVWLIKDPTSVLKVLQSHYFDLADSQDRSPHSTSLTLNPNAKYAFTANGEKQPDGGADEFFTKHPTGTYVIQFAAGCVPMTMLETLPDKTNVGSVILNPADHSKPEVLKIVTSESGHGLLLMGKRDLRFRSR